MSILLRALISHFGAWLAECAHSRGVLPGFHCCMLLSLCLGHHTPSAGGPFSALTPSIWPQEILAKYTQVRRGAGRVNPLVLCRKKGTLVAFGVSKHCRGKEGERHCSTTGLVADACLPLDLHLFGFWLSQEDLAGRQATRASYCPAVWQLLLHCENVDTRREPLSPSGRSGRLARSRKGSPPGGQSRKEGSSPGALQPARGVCRRQLRPERQVRAELGALLGHGMSRWACREWRHPVGF